MRHEKGSPAAKNHPQYQLQETGSAALKLSSNRLIKIPFIDADRIRLFDAGIYLRFIALGINVFEKGVSISTGNYKHETSPGSQPPISLNTMLISLRLNH